MSAIGTKRTIRLHPRLSAIGQQRTSDRGCQPPALSGARDMGETRKQPERLLLKSIGKRKNAQWRITHDAASGQRSL